MQQNHPALAADHLHDARLFANRFDMAEELGGQLPPNPAICEVGVALGDFSDFLIKTLRPSRFVGIDLFRLHELSVLWGTPTADIFGGRSHSVFYRARFPDAEVIEGDSAAALAAMPAKSLDFIYIDGDHSYEGVKRDIEAALHAVKDDGLLIFNDYLMYDHVQRGEYGVVQAVNELVATSDWRVVGFAFQHQMFCDIALKIEPRAPYISARMREAQYSASKR